MIAADVVCSLRERGFGRLLAAFTLFNGPFGFAYAMRLNRPAWYNAGRRTRHADARLDPR